MIDLLYLMIDLFLKGKNFCFNIVVKGCCVMQLSDIKQKLLETATLGEKWVKTMVAKAYSTPEYGFKEEKTSALVRSAF